MEFIPAKFSGTYLLKPKVHRDHRGFFLESYTARAFNEAGISIDFIQDNHSMSVESGVLRGMHMQKPPFAQSKLIRAIRGAIFDVVIDVRKNSPTFGQWEGFELTEGNFWMVLVPAGLLHGFCTLAPNTEVMYKVDKFYSPQHEDGVIWNDPDLGIPWPVANPILSEKDKKLPQLKNFTSPF
jgi:dTDP-4-dehydrorhamnose 3,5-epimerase